MKGGSRVQEYLTKSERIQAYIKEVLEDEQKHGMKEIVAHVDSKLKENGELHLGMYPGATWMMMRR